MTEAGKPQLTKVYHHTFVNSENWKNFSPRESDIVVATSYKGGTTWMQAICGALVFQSPDPPAMLDELSPWIDAVFEPNDVVLNRVESLQHRRYLKSHLPLSALPYFDEVKYIFVCRDGRDVFMSMMNHLNNMKPERVQELARNRHPDAPELPPPAPDLSTAFDNWISQGSYPWEQDGYPIWSHHYHAQTWWDYRHLDNILAVHFQDLLDDLDGQMRRISAFLEIPVDEAKWPELVRSVTFGEMQKNAEVRAPGAGKGLWKDTKNFFHKGTNRRWESVLSPDQVSAYEDFINNTLDPGLVRWLIHNEGFLDPKTL